MSDFQLPKNYDPKAAEEKWLAVWEDKGYFHADPGSKRPRYSIVIPPPNVTGVLHLGHALNNTMQDIMIRYKRMDGYNTLWMPGTDHAGIATQNVVEKALRKDGRLLFIDKQVKPATSGADIVARLQELGVARRK